MKSIFIEIYFILKGETRSCIYFFFDLTFGCSWYSAPTLQSLQAGGEVKKTQELKDGALLEKTASSPVGNN